MKAGPAMGKLLAEIREKQLQDELTTPEAAGEYAREWLSTQASASPVSRGIVGLGV